MVGRAPLFPTTVTGEMCESDSRKRGEVRAAATCDCPARKRGRGVFCRSIHSHTGQSRPEVFGLASLPRPLTFDGAQSLRSTRDDDELR